LFPGITELLQTLIAAPQVRVGLVTRNITTEPAETLRQLFLRHGIDLGSMDFVAHVPLREEKTPHFRAARERFGVNPARSYACGDERKDFLAALAAGMHPFMVSYGFEDYERLTEKHGVPAELISRTPADNGIQLRKKSHSLKETEPILGKNRSGCSNSVPCAVRAAA